MNFSCSKNSDLDNSNTNLQQINAISLATDSNGLSLTSAKLNTIHGDIVIRFFSKSAPKSTSRIISLIQSKFYDGMIIHRSIPNFVIQFGDPSGLGDGGSGVKLPFEANDKQHIKGTVGLARGDDPNSADSQIYICLTTLSHLDKKNTVIGQVVEGFEVLSKLSKGDKINSIILDLK